MWKPVDPDLWRHNAQNGCSLQQQCVWKQSRPIKRLDTLVAKGNVITMSPVLVGRNFNSVDILLTFTLCQCNVMTLLNNLSGTGAWLLIYKVYCKYILCIEDIVKASWVTFFLQAGVTSWSTSYYCKKPVSQYCSNKSIFWTLIAERMFHIQAIYINLWPIV